MEYIVLNNGVKCPVIGIGTFMLSPADAENYNGPHVKTMSKKYCVNGMGQKNDSRAS